MGMWCREHLMLVVSIFFFFFWFCFALVAAVSSFSCSLFGYNFTFWMVLLLRQPLLLSLETMHKTISLFSIHLPFRIFSCCLIRFAVFFFFFFLSVYSYLFLSSIFGHCFRSKNILPHSIKHDSTFHHRELFPCTLHIRIILYLNARIPFAIRHSNSFNLFGRCFIFQPHVFGQNSRATLKSNQNIFYLFTSNSITMCMYLCVSFRLFHDATDKWIP